jgi:hypothetical protein
MELAQHKRHKKIGEEQKQFTSLRLLVQKSPFNCAVVTGMGHMFWTRIRLII